LAFLQKIKAYARRLRRDSLLLWYAGKHPLTPFILKVFVLVVVAYALSPIDLIPDFIPVLGYLDEVLLLPLVVGVLVRWLPGVVMDECRDSADRFLESGGVLPVSWGGGFLVVAIWVGGLVFLFSLV